MCSVNVIGALLASAWTLGTAPLAKEPATGREISADVHELRIPARGSCGWWATTLPVTPSGGVRFRATAEIAMDRPDDRPWNDLMLFVRFDIPKGAAKPRSDYGFYQRDFVTYTDRLEGGRIVRSFDETFAVPGACSSVEIEFIGKWHAMTVRLSGLEAAAVARPKPRKVRCVVGNPHEATGGRKLAGMRKAGVKVGPEEVFAVRLGQIEETLTNIFAHVERPDIILFSECLSGAGADDPATVAERIPGGPSWKLAEKYARRYRVNIALDVKERDEDGHCHNTVFVVDREGRLAGRYRKCHLTSGEYQQGLVPGDGFPIFDLDFGKVGTLICWDNWFSESIKLVKRNGAELLLFPLAGCAPDHVEKCFPARAIDSGLPILVAMRQGHLPNGIIDRDGTWLAQTMEDNGFAVADVDLAERKRTYWLSVGPGDGDPYELYYDESRPEIYQGYEYGPRR